MITLHIILSIIVVCLFISGGLVESISQKTECTHEHKATFESHKKQVCIDCHKEFPYHKKVNA